MSEIEKQFFDTFGIEPKLLITKDGWEKCKNLPRAEELFKQYPQITDRIYLELIRIHFGTRLYDNIGYRENLDKLKEFVLKELTESYKNDFYDFREEVKEKVQALFKEE